MKFPRVKIDGVRCGKKRCGAIAFEVKDAKRIVIECATCRKFTRGEDEATALALWLDEIA